ncbi:hypothetical protein PRIC1_014970 [Phytophthora ramorum]
MASTTATLAALLRALRQASTAPAASDAMDQSVDRLISTSSLSEAQNLVFGLLQCAKGHHSAAFTESLHGKLQQAAAICTEPSSKAQYLGFVLLEESVHLLETLEVSTQRQVLLQCFNANKSLLSGYVAALTAADGPFWGPSVTCETAKRTLHMVAPVLKTVLMDNSQTEGHKAAVLDALCRIAWHFGDDSEDHEAVRTSVVSMLVQALELVPHSRLAQTAYVTHVALIVNLLSTLTDRSKEQVALAKRTARFVLESTQILIGQDVGVIALLQSLEQLAQAVPEAFWCSVFLASTAYFLVDKCETPLEQQLVLRMLAHALTFGREVVSSRPDGRGVYVEILLLPLSSMIALHGSAVSELLKLVMEIKSATTFHPQADSGARAPPTKTATHARSAVRLISDEDVCRRWLDSLFPLEDAAHSDANSSTDKWLALLLVALLSDGRSSLCGHAAKCFERQVNSSPKFWGVDSTKSLVASLVFLVSQHPSGNAMVASARHFGEWLTSCLYSLAALAATTTDTMRIVLRLIDSMNGTTKMRPMALKLMYEVWRHESRVFPRLESMLLEATALDEDAERRVVKMATVKMLCEEDPELGVQFISSIQGFLEDELESVVSMAMDAITALCGGDCLDFYVAFKIIAQKMRKNKVGCADEPLFQERLCCFYALGGAESAANEKHASKLLSQAWEFADSEHPSVRKAAYAAMSKFPLGLLGLSMPADGVMEHDSDEEDQVTEEEVEEQLDDLMQRLRSEHDADVRPEIEKLMTRVIEHESAKLTVGVGRGQRMASAASGDKWQQQQTSQQTGSVMVVSAAATKEMKALLPSRAEVLALFSAASSMADWSGFLLAYQPKAAIDTKSVKRKDKLVRLATQNVDELVETVGTVLQSIKLPWASTSASTDADSSCEVFLLMQALMKGWRTFMATYIASLDELAELKTPVGVDDADVAFRVFSEGVASLIVSLLRDSPNTVGGTMAVGALLGQLCETRHWQNPQLRLKYEETVEELSRRLALSIEQARVFSVDDGDFRSSSIGASLALQLSFGRRKVDAGDDCSNFCLQLEKIEQMFKELYLNASDELLRASALFGLSHIGALYTNSENLETFETTQWRQQRVKPIAELVFSSFLQSKSSSNGDVVFPLDKATEASASIDKVPAAFDQSGSSSDVLLRWASLVGLAHLASGFSSIRRLDWLTNVRRVLEAVWETVDGASVVAVALGPVLLECVQFNLTPSSSLENFVASCIQRAADSDTRLGGGFVVTAAAFVLCRLEFFGGFPSTIQNQTRLVVEGIKGVLENERSEEGAVRTLMLSGIANFFHLAFGMSGSSRLSLADSVELTLDPSTIDRLVKLARAESAKSGRDCGFAGAVLGAIASTADGFYVSQKKKSFDVELHALPARSLLAKTLEWLRQTNPSENVRPQSSAATAIPETRVALSLLNCLASAGSVLPLLDYASLTHRVMMRFCSVETSVACVRFAATQGSCDELLAGELLSSTWFGNVDTAVQTQLIGGLSRLATRVPTDVLRALLVTIFDVLKDIWRCEVPSSSSAPLFDSWTSMLSTVLDATPSRRISETSLDMVNQLVLEKIVVELPFGLEASHFVEQFAIRVLSKVNYGEPGPVGAFLMPSGSNSSTWSWWRSGVFVVELAHLNVQAIGKREASLLFQWILRHEFDEWTDGNLVDTYLQPLIARVGALVAQHTRPGDNVSSLLDVLDAFSRGMASLDFSVRSDEFKRRALFDVVACVLSWNLSLSHEKFMAKLARSEVAGINTATDLLPFGLTLCAHRAKSVSALGERLLALLQQLARLEAAEAAGYSAALQVCSRQMHIAADSWHTPSTMQGEIREFWSMSSMD